jgi:hypothetical protein
VFHAADLSGDSAPTLHYQGGRGERTRAGSALFVASTGASWRISRASARSRPTTPILGFIIRLAGLFWSGRWDATAFDQGGHRPHRDVKEGVDARNGKAGKTGQRSAAPSANGMPNVAGKGECYFHRQMAGNGELGASLGLRPVEKEACTGTDGLGPCGSRCDGRSTGAYGSYGSCGNLREHDTLTVLFRVSVIIVDDIRPGTDEHHDGGLGQDFDTDAGQRQSLPQSIDAAKDKMRLKIPGSRRVWAQRAKLAARSRVCGVEAAPSAPSRQANRHSR